MRKNLPTRFQSIGRSVGIGALALLFTVTASAQTTVFGSGNDGFGGFTSGTSDVINTAWTNETTGLRFTNDGVGNNGQVNSSLLKEFTLDRSSGSTYTFTGEADWISSYAADNNRLGISLFSTSGDIAGADSGLSLQVNIGNGTISISNGVNGTLVETTSSAALSGATGADLIGETLTFTALVAFVGADMDIDFTLAAPDLSYSQTVSATVLAAGYGGDFFGFSSRGRVRGTDTRIDPFIYEANSFSVVPEVSAYAFLFGGAALGFVAVRRRR